ncbi:MAG: cyclic nucleotide-binding domain-containing protein [Pseudomonadales bacterium]|nr:cyclic nucleotide-binding domain-containing protein [Pseudomonadales bacterium]
MKGATSIYNPELDLLEKYDDFSSLSVSDLKNVKNGAGVINLKKGRSPLKAVGENNLLYFISGEIEVRLSNKTYFINSQTDEKILRKAFNERNDILTIIATRHSSILFVERSALYDLLAFENMGDYIVEDLTAEDARNKDSDWMQSMLATKLFRKIPPQNIQKLFSSFESKNIGRGIRVVSEGENGDQFYVIKKGNALVSRKGAMGQELEMVTLKPGDYFGEEALVGETTRNASVTMSRDGVLMCLDKESFQHLLQTPVLKSISKNSIDQWSSENRDVVLIDVRLPIEFRCDRTEGSVNIPLSELRDKIPTLREETRYVIACSDGCRSRLGAYLLNEAGLDAYVLAS